MPEARRRAARRLPALGATVKGGSVTFRVWAPEAGRVELVLESEGPGTRLPLGQDAASRGLWSLSTTRASLGTLYRYSLDGGNPLPDPCSRSQPLGVHGPSAVVDPAAFAWTDEGWTGLQAEALIIYELHTGAFTRTGTFDGVAEKLDYLAGLGVTALELMPVAAFPGEHNWGYDGVALYAPAAVYGGPEGLQRLVDAAHRRGLGVILDVVYNHLGPDGNYLRAYSPYYFTNRYQTPWGEAINCDGRHSPMVREYVLQNAEQWVRDYHIDGLRLDATHAIHDRGENHLLAEIAQHARAASRRRVVIIAENEHNDVHIIRPRERGGHGLDAVWADDFHHAVHTALTGEHEGYYEDFSGRAGDVARAVGEGFLYQGQRSAYLGRRRGTRVTDEPANAFVFCLQNHDQVGNRAFGERLNHLVTPDLFRAATALLLCVPETPLLFMGQEFAAGTPFLFFTAFHEELGRLVTEGRRREFGRFSAFRDPAMRDRVPDPQAEETFRRSRIDWQEVERNAGMLLLYHDLIALRRTDPVLSQSGHLPVQTGVLGERALWVLRRAADGMRVLLVNYGDALALEAPLSFPGGTPEDWRLLLSTTEAGYRVVGEVAGDGPGAGNRFRPERDKVPARSALLLAPA